MEKIKIGIYGFGNLGKGVLEAIKQNPDMELVAIFTRRNPKDVASKLEKNVTVVSTNNVKDYKGKIDVMIACGGSATDLPEQTPMLAQMFNVVDSFDTHAKIPEHYAKVNEAAKRAETIGVISAGWDPGMFSLNRLYAEAILPKGNTYTFWGKGVSQGHSDAIRRIEGVKDARQYTIPIEEAVNRVRSGENPDLTTREKHLRECFVVLEEGEDRSKIEAEIKNMPNYFADYDTTVYFISEDELLREHSKLPHGGNVLRSGVTGDGNKEVIEYKLNLDSNPEFTGAILVAVARAAYRMNKNGESGARTMFSIAPELMSPLSEEDLIKSLM